jgi:hypothetical protein
MKKGLFSALSTLFIPCISALKSSIGILWTAPLEFRLSMKVKIGASMKKSTNQTLLVFIAIRSRADIVFWTILRSDATLHTITGWSFSENTEGGQMKVEELIKQARRLLEFTAHSDSADHLRRDYREAWAFVFKRARASAMGVGLK